MDFYAFFSENRKPRALLEYQEWEGVWTRAGVRARTPESPEREGVWTRAGVRGPTNC
jgi:hypothetical protein